MRATDRRGFTLLELSVALLVGVTVIAGARVTLAVMVDHAQAMSVEGAATAKEANGERLLRQLVLHAEAGADPSATFGGTAQGVEFHTWCVTHQGWSERCIVALTLDRDENRAERRVLRAWLPDEETLQLLEVEAPARFAFLEDPAHGGRWSATWGPSASAPRALGVFSGTDTLILRVGGRQ